MDKRVEQRRNFRRFQDRRVTLMLSIHEILFYESDKIKQNQSILEAIRQNFGTDRAAFLTILDGNSMRVRVDSCVGDWSVMPGETVIEGPGIDKLVDIHQASPGTLSLTNVRRPSVFSPESWDALWTRMPGLPAAALLSIEVRPESAKSKLLWLHQVGYSREWSSRDRDMIEEVAALLAKAADKECV